MKIKNIPTRVFETGDKVLTGSGKGVVIYDELEDYDPSGFDDPVKAAEQAVYQQGVFVRMLEETNNIQIGDELAMNRDVLILEG